MRLVRRCQVVRAFTKLLGWAGRRPQLAGWMATVHVHASRLDPSVKNVKHVFGVVCVYIILG